MNSQQFHEALSQLPDDLIEEADRLRSRKRAPIPLRRYAAMAACFVLVLSASLFALQLMQPKGAVEMAMLEPEEAAAQAAPEAPAAPAPDAPVVVNGFSVTGSTAAESAAEEAAPQADAAEDTAAKSNTFSLRSPRIPGAAADFSLKLLQQTTDAERNTLISPLSILCALGMTSNGAQGNTLAQMEAALALDTDALNSLLSRQSEELLLANSLWLRDDGSLQVEDDYLQTVTDVYRAEVFRTRFDSAALNRLNTWVSEKTAGRIPSMLDQMDDSAVMYLINALTFDADWEEPYEAYQVSDGIFTTENGTHQPVSMMHSTEDWYLETETATGFMKYYQDRRYAFAALLPAEGTTVSELLADLDPEELLSQLSAPREAVVRVSLPKFTTEWESELSEILQTFGITDAFDAAAADFSRLGTGESGNLYLSRVLHKTHIQVTEEGTTAAAATMMEMVMGAAYNPDVRIVTLDRPFVYLIVDCTDGMPVFVGTQMDMADTPAA